MEATIEWLWEDDAEWARCTAADFRSANEDDDTRDGLARALATGEEILLGGSAAPVMVIRAVRS